MVSKYYTTVGNAMLNDGVYIYIRDVKASNRIYKRDVKASNRKND